MLGETSTRFTCPLVVILHVCAGIDGNETMWEWGRGGLRRACEMPSIDRVGPRGGDPDRRTLPHCWFWQGCRRGIILGTSNFK